MSDPKPCYVCGAPVGTYRFGWASYSGPATSGEVVPLCHPNDPTLPDCYTNFCRQTFASDFSRRPSESQGERG